jgi:hypothetical protein
MPQGQYPTVYAGEDYTAGLIQSFAPTAAWKTAPQTVTDSATLVNDTDLVLPLAANAYYEFRMAFAYTGTPGDDLKGGFTVPSGAVIAAAGVHIVSGGASTGINYISSSGQTLVFYGATGGNAAEIHGTVFTGNTAGNLQWEFAQNTAAASTSAVMLPGSVLVLRRLA